jgi:hypothetical protein
VVLTTVFRHGRMVILAVSLLAGLPTGVSRAQTPLRDPNLSSVSPEALQLLTDSRVRQAVIRESLAHYQGRCVCPDDPQDSNGKSCQGRHERITTAPLPLCYPHQVTDEMINDWRRANPGGR